MDNFRRFNEDSSSMLKYRCGSLSTTIPGEINITLPVKITLIIKFLTNTRIHVVSSCSVLLSLYRIKFKSEIVITHLTGTFKILYVM